ncbi:MAG: hypothetical protein ABH873_04775 [Candidatus Firestonebacteria bacterium]
MSKEKEIEILKPLVDELLQLSSTQINEQKKKMWAEHQSLSRNTKIPVCVYYECIPDSQWKLMLGENFLKSESNLGKKIEFDLRKRLWMAKNVPDDHIVLPFIVVKSILAQDVNWGVPLKWVGSGESDTPDLEAKRIEPPFKEKINLNKLKFADIEIDEKANSVLVEEANKLVEGRVPVFIYYHNLEYSPFDKAVEFRGLENLLYDVIDVPNEVHSLMDFIVTNYEKHHKNREEKGWINCISIDSKYKLVSFRVHSAFLSKDFNPKKPRLCDEWAYIAAQTSSGLSPTMYEEFVQPYNVRLARFFTNNTVYYHGCENLDKKINAISTLPNLRRFHVSPWSSVKVAQEKFKESVVLEIHTHPGKVFFGFTKEDMKSDIKKLVEEAKGSIFDLNLSDIHSVNNNPKLLTMWAEAAQEIVGG